MGRPKRYNIKHRKVRNVSMIFEEQRDWIRRNRPPECKDMSAFVCHLLSLGIRAYINEKISKE